MWEELLYTYIYIDNYRFFKKIKKMREREIYIYIHGVNFDISRT
jgi:hypothetical protein